VAGAILCAVCENQGHKVTARDLQWQFNDFLEQRSLLSQQFDAVFYDNTLRFTADQQDVVDEFIDQQTGIIASEDYQYIVISLFSYLSQRFARAFIKSLRESTPAQIIIGGPGVTSISFARDENQFAESLLSQGQIDCFITGEAEYSLPQYFAAGAGPGINNRNFRQIDDLNSLVSPNYSYYNFDHYQSPTGRREVVIVGSRGCVRSCTFCDVAKTSPRYRYRSGASIAQEIIANYEQHGVREFYFADSLVNGSLRAFNDMCETLAAYNFAEPIAWRGQYIIRNQKTVPQRHFELLAAAGCRELFVGIETGSDRVRWDIGKKFTNDDIEYHLQGFERHGISCLFLFFTGYVTETPEDHQQTLEMFPRWQRYVATGTISAIETLNILSILPGAPLEHQAREQGFHFETNWDGTPNSLFWRNPRNASLDFPERLRRHLEMMETAMQYRWPIWNGELSLEIFQRALTEYQRVTANPPAQQKIIALKNLA
jgi:radical SAM superfamily enzyme YgiQ (UPF0313 family)